MLIDDYFNIQYGQKEYESKSRIEGGTTPLVSSSSTDNGIYGFFNIKPEFIDVISYPRTGSIGEARVHDYPCCIDNNCLVLIPKIKLNKSQLYYVASVLKSQKWRFKYGRQATEDRIKYIEVPLMDEICGVWTAPDIKTNENILHRDQFMLELNRKLNGKSLGDLFDIQKGEGAYYQNCNSGTTPMVSASEMDNGIIGFVDISPTFDAPCITIERIRGKSHVQTTDFATVPDDIFVLKPKCDFSIQELFFVATLLNFNRWRFNYHRKATKNRLEQMSFKINKNNNTVQLVIVIPSK